MDKLKMHTPDLAEENYKKLAALFPDAVTETITGYDEKGRAIVERAIDKDVLMQEINAQVVDDEQERYQFTWPDKRKSVILANAPIAKTLRFEQEKSVGRDGTPGGTDSENIYIEGDNLDALKLLQETYLGKVNVIYIDPPYNTGNALIYKNDYYQQSQDYLNNSGQYDDEGNRLVLNPMSNGRWHTDWLNMIYVRLKVAKDLLTNDGIICLTIDDFEISNVTKIMDEIFGESNHLGTVIIKNNPQGRSSVTGFQISHEYALFYSKSKEAQIGRLPRNEDQLARYKEKDQIGPFEWRNFRAQYSTESPKMVYPIYVKKDCSNFRIPNMKWNESTRTYDVQEKPLSDELVKLPIDKNGRTRTWKWSIETVKAVRNTEMGVRKDRSGTPTVYYKGRMKDEGMLPYTIWDKSEYSSSTFGANLVAEIMGKNIFSYPKSIYAVIDCLKVACTKDDAIIMDFFSGSATTADAVMQLNANGGNRKFIMVQFPEEVDKNIEAKKAGYKTICDIGEERIRRAGKIIKEETGAYIDYGFRCFKVDSSNMKDVYYRPAELGQMNLDQFTDNIKEDRTPEDLLIQVMLDLGVLLSSKVERTGIAGKKVFSVDDGYLIACFDKDVTDEVVTAIAKQQPFYAVFRDSSFGSDSVAANFEQIFATYSPQTVRKVL